MKKIIPFALSLLLMFGLTSCDMLTNHDESPEGTGKLTVLLTDAPFPIDLVSEAKVSIDSVVIRRTGESDLGNPFITVTTEAATYDLLTLQNGVTATLAELNVPEGDYDLIRLYVDSASVTLRDGDSFEAFVPSGAQTGIKVFIEPEISVQGGLTSELLLDVDVSKSFILKGNMFAPAGVNGFNFKPVIRAVNLSSAGRITGTVRDSTGSAVSNKTQVWAARDTVVSNTFTDDDGSYALTGLPEGNYTVGTVLHGDTVSTSGVEVVAGNATELDLHWSPGNGKSAGSGD